MTPGEPRRGGDRLRQAAIFLLGISVGICFTLIYQEVASNWRNIVAVLRGY